MNFFQVEKVYKGFLEYKSLYCKVIIFWVDCWIIVIDFLVSVWISSNFYIFILLDYQVLELMNEMKVVRYFLEIFCDFIVFIGIYFNLVDGWNKCKYIVFIV